MIRKTVLLRCDPARAFTLFTEHASEWWPVARRHAGDPRSEIRFVPNGRFYERAGDGREVELGHVRLWEPPHRLALDFYIGTDRDHPTDVEITFAAEQDGTRVTVIHLPTAASEELFGRRATAFDSSWTAVLDALSRTS